MAFVNFIDFYNTLDEALFIRTSPQVDYYEERGIQLLPNNTLPYIQITNVTGGIELEDWTVFVVDKCTGTETDITAQFLVDEIFTDDSGDAQFKWSITNVAADFGNNLVYLKAIQSIGETFYSNVFQFTANESEKTTRIDYKEKTSDSMQSIQVKMWFWQPLKNQEVSTYYETSTRNTVTTVIKSQKYERWITQEISNDLFIKISEVFENKLAYINLIRSRLFEAVEVKEHAEQQNFEENILKITFNNSDVYDPLFVAPVSNLIPEITLTSVVPNGFSAIYTFSYSNFTPNYLTLQTSQDQVSWNSTNVGITSSQSIPFTGTGTWYFRIIHPEAISNVIQLDLGSSVVANNDTFQVAKGGVVDIPVLVNDTLVGSTTITNVSTPTNGTAAIIESGTKIRYTHNDNTAAFDTFNYTISNGITSDSADVNGTITNDGSSTAFSISNTGRSSEDSACVLNVNGTLWHNGDGVNPALDNFIFNDASLSNPYEGGDFWYAISGGVIIKINELGKVIDITLCGF